VSPAKLHIGGKVIDLQVGQTILAAALLHDVPLDHACGGVCACSTCHVRIVQGLDCFSEPSEDELDQLDEARGTGLDSRLGCQARLLRVPPGVEIAAEIPSWNVNMVKEGH
jgi:ferredoxin, 2Fe-2S